RPPRSVIIIQQHLDADGVFDRRHLAFTDAPGELAEVTGQAPVPLMGLPPALLAPPPYLIPQPGRMPRKQEDQQQAADHQPFTEIHQRTLRAAGSSVPLSFRLRRGAQT